MVLDERWECSWFSSLVWLLHDEGVGWWVDSLSSRFGMIDMCVNFLRGSYTLWAVVSCLDSCWMGNVAGLCWTSGKEGLCWTGREKELCWTRSEAELCWTGSEAGLCWTESEAGFCWTRSKAGLCWRGSKAGVCASANQAGFWGAGIKTVFIKERGNGGCWASTCA